MKRFPGITVDHTDATGDKLIARIVAEGRGGRVIADTFGGGLTYISQMAEQKLLDPMAIPEAAPIRRVSKLMFGSPPTPSISSSARTPIWSRKAKSPRASKI
jgi:ABC-type Fe3+ transport system substrate-binding protein